MTFLDNEERDLESLTLLPAPPASAGPNKVPVGKRTAAAPDWCITRLSSVDSTRNRSGSLIASSRSLDRMPVIRGQARPLRQLHRDARRLADLLVLFGAGAQPAELEQRAVARARAGGSAIDHEHLELAERHLGNTDRRLRHCRQG